MFYIYASTIQPYDYNVTVKCSEILQYARSIDEQSAVIAQQKIEINEILKPKIAKLEEELHQREQAMLELLKKFSRQPEQNIMRRAASSYELPESQSPTIKRILSMSEILASSLTQN